MKDYCYASLFDKKDLPYIKRLAEEVRATHNQDLVNEFNNLSEKKWNDHNPVLEINGKTIEPQQVSKANDLVVNLGVATLIAQIIGPFARWRYIGKGTGVTVPAGAQTALVTEVFPRSDMSINGWREYASTSLRFAAIFGESTPTISVTEVGIFDTITAGTMLNRNMFDFNPCTHTVNTSVFVISSIIEFVPVV